RAPSAARFPVQAFADEAGVGGGRMDGMAYGARRVLTRLDRWAAHRARPRGRLAVVAHEFVVFGLKQAAACLFGGLMVALLLASWRWYPRDAGLSRYDFLTLAALAIQ